MFVFRYVSEETSLKLTNSKVLRNKSAMFEDLGNDATAFFMQETFSKGFRERWWEGEKKSLRFSQLMKLKNLLSVFGYIESKTVSTLASVLTV